MKTSPTFSAICAECKSTFSRPELSDHEYGAALLSTSDGKHHAYATAFDEFPKRARQFITLDFWPTLCRLADPIDGLTLVSERPCPNCGSTNLKSSSGDKIGETKIKVATFRRAEQLTDAQLADRIANQQTW